MKRIYLDWAAATPLLPAAQKAMLPWLCDNYANPSAIHSEGQKARDAVEAARGQVATALQIQPQFITWTGSGTEANNIAILGVIEKLHSTGRPYSDMEVISTAIEHPSVSQTLEYLSKLGVVVHKVTVKETGLIDLSSLQDLVNEKTVLLTAHYVNSEIGTIQPTRAIRKILLEKSPEALLHIDAAQAPLWLSCQFDSVGADLLTLDAGKCCGPKGIGLLLRSRRADLSPVFYGGGQENGLRPGTENVAGTVGAAVALVWAQAGRVDRESKVSTVRHLASDLILRQIPEAILNGPTGDDRVANNINVSIPGLDTEFATVVLDKHGFAVSTKSACSGASGGVSNVVLATTKDTTRASSTLRITLGPDSSAVDVESMVAVLQEHLTLMRII